MEYDKLKYRSFSVFDLDTAALLDSASGNQSCRSGLRLSYNVSALRGGDRV